MAPIGVKLWENSFQAIPDISFFVAVNVFLAFFLFQKCWRPFLLQNPAFFERHWQIPRRKSLLVVRFFFSTILGGGGKVVETVFAADLAPKFFHTKPFWLYYNLVILIIYDKKQRGF